jgi:hypothetical protein
MYDTSTNLISIYPHPLSMSAHLIRVGQDEHIGNTVTSRFKVDLSAIASGNKTSGACGSGWRYECRQTSKKPSVWGANAVIYFEVHFDSHLSSNIDLKKTIVTIQDERNGSEVETSMDHQVPPQGCVLIARWSKSSLPNGVFTLKIMAIFSAASNSFRASSSFDPSLSLQALVWASFRSDRFIDMKFYCFSRRLKSGMVDKPIGLFANSQLLAQHSPYISTRT